MSDSSLGPCPEWEKKLAAGPAELSLSDQKLLDLHLETCPTCLHVQLAYKRMDVDIRYTLMPERPLEVNVWQLQLPSRKSISAPGSMLPPEFLKLYLQEHTQITQIPNHLSAFSTAETGPLPVIQAKRRGHPRSRMSQFAVLGLAAMFLMVLMMGGITSLILPVHNNLT